MPETKRSAPPKRRKKKRSRAGSRFRGFLFVLLILVVVAIMFDYILFAFHVPPVFAVETTVAGETAHRGLLYTVTERAGEPMTWEWIWEKLLQSFTVVSEAK